MNLSIFLLSVSCFVVVAIMSVTGPLLPVIASEFGVSVGAAGIIVTAFAVPYGAFQIVFGPLGDRFGKLRMVAAATAVGGFFALASAFTHTLDGLASMRFFTGLAMAGTVPLAMAYIADEIPFDQRQPVMGQFVHGIILGQIAGGALGGITAEYFEWRVIFIVFGVGALICAALLGFQARRKRLETFRQVASAAETLTLYRQLFRQRASRDVILIGVLEGMLIFGVAAYLGAFLRHVKGFDYALIGMVLAVYGLGGMVYSLTVNRVVRRFDEPGRIMLGGMLLGSGYVLMVVVPALSMLFGVFLVAGFGFYVLHNTMQTRATELSETARGAAVSLWVFMLFAGQGLGVWVLGYSIDAWGYESALYVAAGGIIGSSVWYSRSLRRWSEGSAATLPSDHLSG